MQPNMRAALRSPELLLLSALALLTRFWGLFSPDIVIWDEMHFERFVGGYYTGRYFIDVHPPLGKLLLFWSARLLGIPGDALVRVQPAPLLRVVPALAGALLIPVVYLLLRELKASRRIATLAAFVILLDNALLVESRLILMDSMLIFFAMLSLLLYVAGRRRMHWHRFWCLLGAAVAAGAAASIKWTGLTALGLIMLDWMIEGIARRWRFVPLAREGALLMGVPVLIYAGSFAMHFALLPNSGTGDSWMSPQFRATLVGSPEYVPGATISFARAVHELNNAMSAINIGWATDRNNGASPWYTWPIAKHSMGFWTEKVTDGERWIVLFGNPVVWLGTLAGVLIVLVSLARRSTALSGQGRVLSFLGVAWLVNFVPFAFIQRPMYLYHYFIALIFSVMFASMGIGALAGWAGDDGDQLWAFPSRAARLWYAGVAGLTLAAFVYLAPMSYGWTLGPSALEHRRDVIERHL